MSIRSTVLLLCIGLVLLQSCILAGSPAPSSPGSSGSPDVPTAIPTGATIITFAAPPNQHAVYQPLINAFQQRHPDLRIQLVPVEPGTPMAQLVTAADTAIIETNTLSELDSRYLLDLTPLADSAAAFQPDAFFPLAASLWMRKQQRYALPLWLEVPTFSYNHDLWAATGLPLPSIDWQWSDLTAAAEQMTQTNPTDPVVYGLQDGANGMLTLIGMLTDAKVDLLGQSGLPALTSPAATAVYAQFFALTKRGSIHTDAHATAQPDGAAADPAARIRAGQVGVWASSLLHGSDAENLAFTTSTLPVPPLPVFPGRVAAHVISVGTRQPQAAWQWLTFVNQQVALQTTAPPSSIPARPDHAAQQPGWTQLNQAQRATLHTRLQQRLPDTMGQTAGISALTSLVMQVQLEQAPLEQALAAVPSRVAEAATRVTQHTAPTVVINTPVSLSQTTHETTITFYSSMHSDQIQEVVDAFNQAQSRVYVVNKRVGDIDPQSGMDDFRPRQGDRSRLFCPVWFPTSRGRSGAVGCATPVGCRPNQACV